MSQYYTLADSRGARVHALDSALERPSTTALVAKPGLADYVQVAESLTSKLVSGGWAPSDRHAKKPHIVIVYM